MTVSTSAGEAAAVQHPATVPQRLTHIRNANVRRPPARGTTARQNDPPVSSDPPSETQDVRPIESRDVRILGLVEMILKDHRRLERAIRDPRLQPLLVSRFLTIALCSFALFGVALAVLLDAAGVWPQLTSLDRVFEATSQGRQLPFLSLATDSIGAGRWVDGSAWQMVFAYCVGLIAATGVCLPSLYFYGLLAGVRMSLIDVVLHSLKSKATAAIGLIGILPLYAAVGMGVVIVFGAAGERGVYPILNAAIWLGLILPFVGGLFGSCSMYRGFLGLVDTMPPERQRLRATFLRRLALSWMAVYTAVSPIMIFTLWEYFGRT